MILILCILTLLITVAYAYRSGITEGIMAFFCCAFASIIIYAICFVEIISSAPLVKVKDVASPIVSLKSSQTSSGSFIVGSGRIDSYDQYIFMRDLGDHRYLRDSIPVTNAILHETNQEKPNLKFTKYIRYHKKTFWFPEIYGETVNKDYVLTVPDGTIIESYNPM